MVEDTVIQSNQSAFASNQAVLQAPPELASPQPGDKKKWLIVGGLGFLLIMAIIAIAALSGKPLPEAAPTPLPSPPSLPVTSRMQQELKLLDEQVKQSNPDDMIITPPQVDMQVEF